MAYSVIKKPSDYFNTKLYTGNGSTNAITGVGFQPDFTWNKGRNDAWNHSLVDSVRGVTKVLRTNTTEAEEVRATNLTSFDTDGFTLGSDAMVNTNGDTLASWNWLANGTGSANTDGSISSTVSANTTAGFSICKASLGTGNFTFGHGLGTAPSIVISKSLTVAGKWYMYVKSIGAGNIMILNETGGSIANSVMWQNTDPSNSVVYANADQLYPNQDWIFYCFADVQGYSKFGSYTGNGSADGTFVYTGFKPAFVIIKRSSASEDWYIWDNKRGTYNPNSPILYADLSNAESTSNVDFLSNGFKCRTTQNLQNASGNSYIYMAFAEQPLVGDNPATAR